MAGPDVSVITTVLNGERYLAESARSALAQTGVDLELMIVDDGSTDGTARVLERLRGDPRVRVLRRTRIGRAPALNEAVAHSRGQYLAVLDADDVCLERRLARSVDYLERHPETDLVGAGQWLFIDEQGTEIGRRAVPAHRDDEIRRVLRRHMTPFPHSSVTMRRAALDAVGGYDENLPMEDDVDLFVRLAANGRLDTLPDALVASRRHRGQFFAERRGGTRSFRLRVATRLTIDRRADAILGGSTTVVSATAREAGAWAYWRARRLAGAGPILPATVRARLDRWWSRELDHRSGAPSRTLTLRQRDRRRPTAGWRRRRP